MTDNPWRGPDATGDHPSQHGNWPSSLLRWVIGLGVILVVAVGFLLPLRRSAGPAARLMQCSSNLRNISLALQNYHVTYGCFPPACTVDDAGRPLHSWRTLILPYLAQEGLYGRIDLAKPWDDPANAEAFQTRVETYLCAEGHGETQLTTFQAIVGSDCFFPNRGVRKLSDITDPHGETLMLLEVDKNHAVPWMSPRDADEALFISLNAKSKLPHSGGFNAIFVDGSARFLDAELPMTDRRAMLTICGIDKLTE